jgi:hypothetical protein
MVNVLEFQDNIFLYNINICLIVKPFKQINKTSENLKNKIMLKNILNLNGAQQLSKNEQKTVNGSGPFSVNTCQYSNCLCNGTPGEPVDASNCEGMRPGVLVNMGHCALILSNGVCYACQ